jgi:hypothetical protein
MISDTPQSFQPGQKKINYLTKDFGQMKQTLINLAQTYYPTSYQDFSATSPGMMYIDMAAMVGDVLSYYNDYQFKEGLLVNAEERQNIVDEAAGLGYVPKTTTPSVTSLDVYQLVPSTLDTTGNTGSVIPDMNYAQIIKPGMSSVSDTGINFLTNTSVDFTVDTQNDPLEISVYQRNAAGQPEFYVLKKTTTAFSGQMVTTTVTVGTPTPFYQINLPDTNVIEVFDVFDSDGNQWYETDFLAQDLVPIEVENIFQNDSTMSVYQSTAPSLLQYIRTSRRFITRVNANNITSLQFGSGTNVSDDEIIVPNIYTVGTVSTFAKENIAYDPNNFLSTRASGQAPANTTLTIRYITGGGVVSNVNANTIKSTTNVEFFGDITELPTAEQNLTTLVRQSVKVNNPTPATGGGDAETNDDIRNNALANFASQLRAVTQQDYQVRAYGMPAKYGAIAKAYAVTDTQLDAANIQASPGPSTSSYAFSPQNINVFSPNRNNPFSINLYLLCYDSAQRLIPTNPAIRQNFTNYLNQYRMLTDSVNLLDGYIINIGVNFSIIAYKSYNKREVLANCISLVQQYFDIGNAQFCQPINLSRLQLEIAKIDGVQSVTSLNIVNLTTNDGDYSPYQYDIGAATVNNIVYPSIDPAVFEIRFPTKDIVGRVA